jgi:uncharacterized protein YndB with AHSA1/START domain
MATEEVGLNRSIASGHIWQAPDQQTKRGRPIHKEDTEMAKQTGGPTTTGEALVIERVFDAPRELVWKAWSDPAMAMRWWGPRGFTAPAAEIDFRVGGKMLLAMQSPDFNEGRPIWSVGVYKEIVPFERIVVTDSFADENGNVVPATHYGMPDSFPLEMLVTVTFEDLGGKTKMTLRHEGLPAGDMLDGAGTGWNESFDKLAEAVAAA